MPQTDLRKFEANIRAGKGPILLLALLAGFMSAPFHWQRAWFASIVALVIPVVGFRHFWRKGCFWGIVVALALAQIPLLAALSRAGVQLNNLLAMFAFAAIDFTAVIVVVLWVCSDVHTG